MVRSINAPRNSVDQGGIPWPMLKNNVHPNLIMSTQGRYRRENNESLALATSSKYKVTSPQGPAYRVPMRI